MPQPSPSDVQALIASYTSFANATVAYQSAHATDPDVDQEQLVMLVSALTEHARRIADDAVATTFNNVANDVKQLQNVVAKADEEAAALKQQAGKYTKIAALAAGVLGIAVGLAAHSYSSTMQSAQNLKQALSAT